MLQRLTQVWPPEQKYRAGENLRHIDQWVTAYDILIQVRAWSVARSAARGVGYVDANV